MTSHLNIALSYKREARLWENKSNVTQPVSGRNKILTKVLLWNTKACALSAIYIFSKNYKSRWEDTILIHKALKMSVICKESLSH